MLLATGSAVELFGKCIDTERDSIPALEILGYGARRIKNCRFLNDCLFKSTVFEKKTLGFVNRCSEFYDTNNSLFDVELGIGYDKSSKNEGFIYKNFIATTLIGPLLVRNPHVLDFVMTRLFEIAQEKPKSDKRSELAQKAYESTVLELEKRVNAK
jgi:CobQ-like glutamine amidotransferase family enzyme